MTILVVPSLNCNLRCGYCFAHGYDWNKISTYDMQAILNSMETLHKETNGDSFCLHGGECTLIDRKDFEAILKKMYELQGKSSLQTNCYKLDDDLIRLFKAYKTSVGVSIDGDKSLNSIRGFPNDREKNSEYTKQVINNIFTLHKEGVSVGLIVVLTKVNAGSNAKLRRLVRFILMLSEHGIKGGRLNLMWSNCVETKKYELTPEEASHAWLYLYKNLKRYNDLQWQPFREFTDNLLGYSHSSCSYGKCDYFCTSTKVILPDGSLGNCDRTHQEGSTYTRASMSYERYEALKATDCNKCRFWDACYGGCPSEGLDGDWRNKTRWCQPIYDLYKTIESDVKALLPNVKLVPSWNSEEDYFEALRKGKRVDAFERMSFATANNPSSWKSVQLKDDQTRQNKTLQPQGSVTRNQDHKDSAHGDYTDHGDSSC
jgi:uncharacterized protein